MGCERLSQPGGRLLRHYPDPYSRHGGRRGGHQAARSARAAGSLPPVGPRAPHHHPRIHVRERGGAYQRHRLGQVQAADQGGALRRGAGCRQAAGGERCPDHRHQHGRGDAGRRGGHGALLEPDCRRAGHRPGAGDDRLLQVGGAGGRPQVRAGQAGGQLHLHEGGGGEVHPAGQIAAPLRRCRHRDGVRRGGPGRYPRSQVRDLPARLPHSGGPGGLPAGRHHLRSQHLRGGDRHR